MATEATGFSWTDLQSDLLVSIASRLSLRDYTCLRGVSAAWRSTLAPPYPCLLSLHDSGRRCSIFSLPMQRSFRRKPVLYTGVEGCGRVVGSGNNGRLAIAALDSSGRTERIFLLDPRTRKEATVLLPPPPLRLGIYEGVRKVVFAPDPDDGTVVAMCDRKRVAYVDTSRRSDDMVWMIVEFIAGDQTDHLADLTFHRAPGGEGMVYCLDSSGGVRVLRIPRRRPEEPWLTVLSASFRAAFPRPYHVASELTFIKHLFFCHDNLYQVWQNTGATVRSRSRLTMAPDEIFFLRHDPGRQWPCWSVAKDLGGCSVFLGQNSNPAVMPAGAAPGVRDDCVYWIDWRGKPMVCDVATGTSKPCVLPGPMARAMLAGGISLTTTISILTSFNKRGC